MTIGWRLTIVRRDGTPHGFTVAVWPAPLMSHDAAAKWADEIEAEAKNNPGKWPGFLGVGIEFRCEAQNE